MSLTKNVLYFSEVDAHSKTNTAYRYGNNTYSSCLFDISLAIQYFIRLHSLLAPLALAVCQQSSKSISEIKKKACFFDTFGVDVHEKIFGEVLIELIQPHDFENYFTIMDNSHWKDSSNNEQTVSKCT